MKCNVGQELRYVVPVIPYLLRDTMTVENEVLCALTVCRLVRAQALLTSQPCLEISWASRLEKRLEPEG